MPPISLFNIGAKRIDFMEQGENYQPKNKIRIVTATSLFDGHDAAINIMRRIMQSTGAEVIHLGHNRSVAEIVECAIQEDAQGIAITSYQGGHTEFLKYMFDLLKERESKTLIVAGGGGTILPTEIKELEDYGINKIYSPDDGRAMGLQGMIEDVIKRFDFDTLDGGLNPDLAALSTSNHPLIGKLITQAENTPVSHDSIQQSVKSKAALNKAPILGITGTGGAGKSSLVDELVRRFLHHNPDKNIAIISVDPSKRKTGGALLGDRIRMNAIFNDRVYMRSLATRQANLALSKHVQDSIDIVKAAGFDLIIIETSGIGQSDTEITEHCDVSMYIMTAEYGAATQLEKIDMLDFADLIALNKFEKRGSEDALRDVRKQYQRNHQLWDTDLEALPIYGTIASQFNDAGVNMLFNAVVDKLATKCNYHLEKINIDAIGSGQNQAIIPPEQSRYLAEIADLNKQYDEHVDAQAKLATTWYQLDGAKKALIFANESSSAISVIEHQIETVKKQLAGETVSIVENWPSVVKKYSSDKYNFQVRDKVIQIDLFKESLSHTKVPKVSLPKFSDWGDLVRWRMRENMPGRFPFASGVYPLKRQGELPTRMFAGEGGPERTNKRFHYVSTGQDAKRLSTAFDSVTLYGEDPDHRPDIYGKIGNSGVSVATIDNAKALYSGFDLASPSTSVSMTINGPAPIVLAFFLNAAIDQQCEKYIHENGLLTEVQKKKASYFESKGQAVPEYNGPLPEGNNGLGLLLYGITGDKVLPSDVYESIKMATLNKVRGTVQADILKEDQAQNTCIFSTEFALKMMGDMQEYFIDNEVRNFYSVSISGYHIAEAGANPITQLALTLANGFTYVEYYLSRGMDVNQFAPNLSFFFSNGIDPEYAVIGRVARRIWAKAMRHKYKANERSQMLKYHIQTSGRSLHAQEISFNDIRTTLQALYAIYDNCNSLHTNAYDEAITTPTEESVRRAMAIQLIINEELGLATNENPLQGAFIIDELTELVEQAVLTEFHRISERGGVLGAMERMYQRSKIQEESLYYETLKHNGEIPIIGVNTFLDPKGSPTIIPDEVIRSTDQEKQFAINSLNTFKEMHQGNLDNALERLKEKALSEQNIFDELMECVKVCSLGQITNALYDVGGKYRRNM